MTLFSIRFLHELFWDMFENPSPDFTEREMGSERSSHLSQSVGLILQLGSLAFQLF
jgi:hypothetical protein